MLITVVVFGLIVGSFINAVVWRLHEQSTVNDKRIVRRTAYSVKELSITKGRSMCPNCGHQLAAIDLIPILSWLSLRGKCRYCHKPISAEYPIVELLTAALFGLSFYVLAPQGSAAVIYFGLWLYILTSLIILAVYDLHWMLLPDVVLLPAVAVTAAYLFGLVLSRQPLAMVTGPLIAGFGAGAGFYALAAITRGKGMGGGDIKLVFLMGLLLGIQKTATALFLAFLSAAIVGVGLIISARLRQVKRPHYIAFGPFLIAATIVARLYGQHIIALYLHASGL